MTAIHRAKKIAAIRARIVSQIADEFQTSGIEYTCVAVIMDFARKRIVPLTDTDECRPYLAHPLMFMKKIEKATWDEIHRRWRAANK